MLNERRSKLPLTIAVCGGVGRLPVAPGTGGALVGVVLTVALLRLPLARFGWWAIDGAAVIILAALGTWAAGRAESLLGTLDPAPVVIDEVAGQILAFVASPVAGWKMLLAGFLLFRAADVLKPFPARRAERLPGGWGIMADDLVAGAYSAAGLWAFHSFLR